jgi:hypothetical protein
MHWTSYLLYLTVVQQVTPIKLEHLLPTPSSACSYFIPTQNIISELPLKYETEL